MSGVLTQEDLDYMRAHGDDNYKPDIIICTSICGIFSILFVVLRLYSRYIAVGRLRLELSDWLLLVAWVRPKVQGNFSYLLTLVSDILPRDRRVTQYFHCVWWRTTYPLCSKHPRSSYSQSLVYTKFNSPWSLIQLLRATDKCRNGGGIFVRHCIHQA